MKGSKCDFFKNVKHIKIQMKEICMNARRTNTQGNSNNQNSKKCDAETTTRKRLSNLRDWANNQISDRENKIAQGK